jgi:hypothetical protein
MLSRGLKGRREHHEVGEQSVLIGGGENRSSWGAKVSFIKCDINPVSGHRSPSSHQTCSGPLVLLGAQARSHRATTRSHRLVSESFPSCSSHPKPQGGSPPLRDGPGAHIIGAQQTPGASDNGSRAPGLNSVSLTHSTRTLKSSLIWKSGL